MGNTADKLQQLIQTKIDIKDAIEGKGVNVGAVPFSMYPEKINEISGSSTIIIPPPEGNFYAAIAYFTGENGDYNNIAYAFANNSTEFTAQFCHSSIFANFTLHSTAGGSDSVVIPNSKMFGFYFGSQFNLTALPNYFLQYCYSFNQPLILPESLTSIGHYFLSLCYSFNQPLTLPESIESIGTDFLYYCHSFNQPLTLPKSLIRIYTEFLYYCYSFNQPLTLPENLTGIGNVFLYNCFSFNQPLILPESIKNIGTEFIYGNYNIDHLIVNCAVSPTDNYSLSSGVIASAAYVNGITVSGTYAQTWINNLPNRSSSPYRKLILG